MKVYKDANMKTFSLYIFGKNILEKEFARDITHVLVLVSDPSILMGPSFSQEYSECSMTCQNSSLQKVP